MKCAGYNKLVRKLTAKKTKFGDSPFKRPGKGTGGNTSYWYPRGGKIDIYPGKFHAILVFRHDGLYK